MRIREVDGLRAFAVISVMAFHYLPGMIPGGYIGVDLFFVISGFVITSGLRREMEASGHIVLRNFYARRFFRIVPPLAFMVASVLLVGGTRYTTDAIIALLSAMNWYKAFTRGASSVFDHTWSLSMEEQFYVIWPLALLTLGRGERAIRWLVALIVAIAVWRATLGFVATPARVYGGLDTRSDELLVGCLIALAAPTLDAKWWPAPVAILGAICLTTRWDAPWMSLAGYSLVALCSGVLLSIALNPSPAIRTLLTLGPVQWVGRRSYGVYLWHYPLGILLLDVVTDTKARLILAAGLTFAMAELSYRFIEQPAARMGHRFGRFVLPSPTTPSPIERSNEATATA